MDNHKSIWERVAQYMREHKYKKRWYKLVGVMASIVVFCTVYALILPAITMERSTCVCGMEEHIHTASCYTTERKLVCTMEENEGHHHTSSCYDSQGNLICGLEESDGHTHTDACYEDETVLVCEKEEHVHTDACYIEETETDETSASASGNGASANLTENGTTETADPSAAGGAVNETAASEIIGTSETETETETEEEIVEYGDTTADVETASDWERIVSGIELTGDWSVDVLAIAESQLGYTESSRNYAVNAEGQKKGYSRYGAWYGDPYGDWCAMFVSWCLYYGEVKDVPLEASCSNWITKLSNAGMYTDVSNYVPQSGDIIFFDFHHESLSDHVGLVYDVSEDGEITTIEGNSGNAVRYVHYDIDDTAIVGYGILPENPEMATEIDEEFQTEAEGADETEMDIDTDPEAGLSVQAEGDAAEIDFKNMITFVKVQYRQNSWDNWQDAAADEEGALQVQQGGQLRFDIQYTVPANTLSDDNKTITYQLPSGITIAEAESGTVYNDSGQAVGTYTIDTSGKVAITFDDTYVTDNSNGQSIDGHIAFESSVSDIPTDDTGKTELEFTDDLKVNIQVTDKTVTSEDLTVTKAAGTFDPADGTMTYTITVSSENGTAGKVTLTDVMSKVGLVEESIKVSGLNDSKYTVEQTSNGFNMTLPQMGAGSTYTITYTAKLTENINGSAQVGNKVTVDSTRNDGAKLQDEASVTTEVKQNLIGKTGVKNADGTITWTIVINESKTDIGGWTLSDALNGESYIGEVTISPAIDGQTNITLPYTFPEGTKDTYTITYTTDADRVVGSWATTNTATLTPGSDDTPGNSVSGSGYVNGDSAYSPLTKSAELLTESEDGKTADILWKVTINASEGKIPAEWFYADTLQGNQWFTKSQLEALKSALENSLKQSGLTLSYKLVAYEMTTDGGVGSEVAYEAISDDVKYKGYRITFFNTLEKGGSFTFRYSSTVSLEDVTTGTTFKNAGNINDKTWANGSIDYTPSKPHIIKTDSRGDGDDTSHHTGDSNMQTDGIFTMEWNLELTIPEGYQGGQLTVKENLPDGVELVYLSISSDGVVSQTDITALENHTMGGYTVIMAQNGQEMTITIPENLAEAVSQASHVISFIVRVKLANDFAWSDASHVFANEVKLLDQKNEVIDTDSQTQTITNGTGEDVVAKSHGTVDANVMPYAIVVNPEGKDLLEGADVLTLKDVMSFAYYEPNGVVSATLVPGSVKIYQMNADGTKGDELSTTVDYPYTYEEKRSDNGWGNVTAENILTITIPDSQAVIVEYSYKLGGNVGSWYQYGNTASLEGVSGGETESKDTINVQIQQSSAGANVDGITIYKVDSENSAKALAGAVFELYHWVEDAQDYVAMQDEKGHTITYTSDDAGQIGLNHLTYNTAYKLVETKAPEGYIQSTEPLYFIISSTDIEKYPVCKPSDFGGVTYGSGAVVYYPNEENTTSLEIDKKWLNYEGEEESKVSGDISVELWQKVSLTPPDASGSGGESSSDDEKECYKTYTLSGPTWKLQIEDLPKAAINEAGERVYYSYYVKEILVEGYHTSYENNDGIIEGTITITNQANKKPEFELPETGGRGVSGYTFGGLLLMTAAGLFMYKRFFRRKENYHHTL